MIKKLILVFLCLNTLLLGCVLYELNSDKLPYDCIPNEEVALDVGKKICQTIYPDIDYSKYVWECMLFENDEWLVFCRNEPRQLGGGLPGLRIKKNNGRVISVDLITK